MWTWLATHATHATPLLAISIGAPRKAVESSGSYGSDYSYYSDSDSAHAKDAPKDRRYQAINKNQMLQ